MSFFNLVTKLIFGSQVEKIKLHRIVDVPDTLNQHRVRKPSQVLRSCHLQTQRTTYEWKKAARKRRRRERDFRFVSHPDFLRASQNDTAVTLEIPLLAYPYTTGPTLSFL